jgi:hypothetical protein
MYLLGDFAFIWFSLSIVALRPTLPRFLASAVRRSSATQLRGLSL